MLTDRGVNRINQDPGMIAQPLVHSKTAPGLDNHGSVVIYANDGGPIANPGED
tara:strand:- start:433 stop:591 length:159 start_codon:yes stop_codon:yes gene_type:complete